MSTAQGNIFLTTENLAFSLPLLLVCGTYVSIACMLVVTLECDRTMDWLTFQNFIAH